MVRTLRVAVLECDTPIDPVHERYGSYGNRFQTLLETGFKTLGSAVELDVTKWDVVASSGFPDVEQTDALVLTGSKHNAFEDHDWILQLVSFVQSWYHKTNKPMFGACFGHQIIARAMGSRVARSEKGWEVSVSEIALSQPGQDLFQKETLYLHQMHRDIVYDIPSGFVNLGSSHICGIQGLYQPSRVLTVQAHPEFNEFIMTRLLEKRHNDGIFDDQIFLEAISRASKSADNATVGAAVCRFLLMASS